MKPMYKPLIAEMININPLFFNEDILCKIFQETLDAPVDEDAYGFLTDSFMILIESDKVKEFKDILKKAVDSLTKKYNDNEFAFENVKLFDIRKVYRKMQRLCNKYIYDKILMKQAIRELKA